MWIRAVILVTMRLLHTSSFELEEFLDERRPPYAILSHTWSGKEISFDDLSYRREAAMQMEAFTKIEQCCKKAALEGYQYVWIDTCCIDKRNSTELSEAINSMFKWYRKASCCYAYLADVPEDCGSDRILEGDKRFARSRWFTRGWTLQELLAPKRVKFLARDWSELGTKETLLDPIQKATGIHVQVLKNITWLKEFSIAQRMSWAARRKTTRVEDKAYCLMGLFGINMPMLYGEGKKAFRRLQLELIREYNDPSLFAWRTQQGEWGLLASSPVDFLESANFIPISTGPLVAPYAVTNLGLSIKVRICGREEEGWATEKVVFLSCSYANGSSGSFWVGIYVRESGNGYYRIRCDELFLSEKRSNNLLPPKYEEKEIFITL